MKTGNKNNLVTILFLLFFGLSTHAQKYISDFDENICYMNKKIRNFTVGDTIYSNAYADSWGEVSIDSMHSSLLDSLAVSLKKSPDIVVLVNGRCPVSKEVYTSIVKNHQDKDTNVLKFSYVRANRAAYFMKKAGITNCIICNGLGYTIFSKSNASSTFKREICDNTVQIILTKNDSVHCYSLKPGKPVILNNIYFDVDKWEILPKSYTELNLFANYLISNPNQKLEISGHTDNTGDYNKNIELSKKRAESVVKYLRNKLVKNSITTLGCGSSRPLRTNNNEFGRAQNRRIEVKVIN